MQEAFVEMDLHEGTARQLRDERAAELMQRGYDCRCHTLYRVLDGMPVYVVQAYRLDAADEPTSRASGKSAARLRDQGTPRRMPEFEVR